MPVRRSPKYFQVSDSGPSGSAAGVVVRCPGGEQKEYPGESFEVVVAETVAGGQGAGYVVAAEYGIEIHAESLPQTGTCGIVGLFPLLPCRYAEFQQDGFEHFSCLFDFPEEHVFHGAVSFVVVKLCKLFRRNNRCGRYARRN